MIEGVFGGEFAHRRPGGEIRPVPKQEIVRPQTELVGVSRKEELSLEDVLKRLANESRRRKEQEKEVRRDFSERIGAAGGETARSLRLERDRVLYDALPEFDVKALPDGCGFANEEVAHAAFEPLVSDLLQESGSLSVARYVSDGERERLRAAIGIDGERIAEVSRRIVEGSYPFIRPQAYGDVIVRMFELMGMDDRLENIRLLTVGQYNAENGSVRGVYFPGNIKTALEEERADRGKPQNPRPVIVLLKPSDVAREYAMGNVHVGHEPGRPLTEIIKLASMSEKANEFRAIQNVWKLPVGEDGKVDPKFAESATHAFWTKSLQAA